MEFLQFSRGMDTMRREDFAAWLLHYTNEEDNQLYRDNMRTKIPAGHSITFEEFKAFCLFANNLDDFGFSVKLVADSQRPIGMGNHGDQAHSRICSPSAHSPPSSSSSSPVQAGREDRHRPRPVRQRPGHHLQALRLGRRQLPEPQGVHQRDGGQGAARSEGEWSITSLQRAFLHDEAAELAAASLLANHSSAASC